MEQQFEILEMKIEDYEEVYALWTGIQGFVLRGFDDSKERVGYFIRRNPTTSMVAKVEGKIVGAILCGHDGRSACFYHVCVQEAYRKQGIGEAMVCKCLDALKKEGISKVHLLAFKENELGNNFWKGLDWKQREDINYYEAILREQSNRKIDQN